MERRPKGAKRWDRQGTGTNEKTGLLDHPSPDRFWSSVSTDLRDRPRPRSTDLATHRAPAPSHPDKSFTRPAPDPADRRSALRGYSGSRNRLSRTSGLRRGFLHPPNENLARRRGAVEMFPPGKHMTRRLGREKINRSHRNVCAAQTYDPAPLVARKSTVVIEMSPRGRHMTRHRGRENSKISPR
jgi:hypothetical protein